MTEPLKPPAESDRDEDAVHESDVVVPTEIEQDVEARAGSLVAPADGGLQPNGSPPEALREIARAFRMNAEALQTLKQMQGDLARSVQRGDRSELVLQSTRSLNDTFRNLTSVQRELLTRLDGRGSGSGRSPLIPVMILGLLVVVVAGVYVILDAVQKSSEQTPQADPAELAQRERDSWKEGRIEGSRQSEREVQRLQDMLDDAKGRTRKLESDLDQKLQELGSLDRGKRTAELERDEFAGQVRKAQNESMAKQVLEEEVAALRSQISSSNRNTTDLEIDLDRQRRLVGWLRQRLADYGMDIPADDPPYVPPARAGRDAKTEDDAKPGARKPESEQPKIVNLLTAGRKKPVDDAAAAKPTGAPPSADPRAEQGAPARPPPPVWEELPRPAAKPGELPPPILRRRSSLNADPAAIKRVRKRINELLDASAGNQGESWQVSRIDGVARDRLGGVILLHYDATGRLIEGVEARDMRITVDKGERTVAFDLTDGVRVAQNKRTPLPADGIKVTVAKGDVSSIWAGSGLAMVRKR